MVSLNCVTWKRGLYTSLVCLNRDSGGCLYIYIFWGRGGGGMGGGSLMMIIFIHIHMHTIAPLAPFVQPDIHRYTQCYTSVILCATQVLALLYTSMYSVPIHNVTLKRTCV